MSIETLTRVLAFRRALAAVVATVLFVAIGVTSTATSAATEDSPIPHLSVTTGNGQATLNWTYTGDTSLLLTQGEWFKLSSAGSYQYVNIPGTAARSFVQTGLDNGRSYDFFVGAGSGQFGAVRSSNVVSATPQLPVPSAPTGVEAVPVTAPDDSPGAAVSWTAPASDGGSAITDYVIGYTDSDNSSSGTYNPSGTGTSATVPGLVAGDHYTFTVSAVNANGTGADSSPSAPILATSVPAAPTAVTATAGSTPGTAGRATVSWTAPAATGGLPITSYTVTWTDITTATAGGPVSFNATSGVVTGLTPGDQYTFVVVATNADGSGAASTASSAITALDVPTSPSGVSAAAGPAGSAATVSWTAPDANGSAITGYTVTATDTDDPSGDASGSFGALATSGEVTGLVPGDHYTFAVVATNAVGDSPASTASAPVLPYTTAGAPTGISATAGTNSAVVQWTTPVDDGGTSITGYVVTYTDTTTNPATNGTFVSSGNETSATVTGLAPGHSYTFSVQAVTSAGAGAASTASGSVAPYTTPGAPSAVNAAVGTDGRPLLTWSAPPTGGSPITGYRIVYRDLTDPAGDGSYLAGADSTTASVPGLTPGHSYTFQLVAVNVAGDSDPSTATGAVTAYSAPGVPAGVVAGVDRAAATVGWTAPTDTGGSAITGYVVRYVDTTDPKRTITHIVGPNALADTATLVPGDSYTISVAAFNVYSVGAAGEAPVAVAPYTVPSAPTALTATAIAHGARLSWSAPGDSGGNPIIGYRVTVLDETTHATRTIFVAGGRTSATVSGLTDGHVYRFTVAAVNAAGYSIPSAASARTTPRAPAPVPLAVVRAVLPDRIAVGLTQRPVTFRMTLNRPGPVTVALVRGRTALAGIHLTVRSTTVTGTYQPHLTGTAQLGTYHWIVRDAMTGAVLSSAPVIVKEKNQLAIRARRTGSMITGDGSAKWVDLNSGRVVDWKGKAIRLQRLTAGRWVTVRVLHADRLGHIHFTMTATGRIGLRLVDSGTDLILDMTSNVVTL